MHVLQSPRVQPHRTNLDLHQLRSVDPIALEVLWTGLRAALRRGSTMSLAGLRPSLQDAVEPLLIHGLRLHDSVRDALAAAHDTSLRP
jgi:hypothetical protein